ncbi:MAG: ABC transporter substrate-binding protein, partial [Candidatus Bathyarchaeia archaeon]
MSMLISAFSIQPVEVVASSLEVILEERSAAVDFISIYTDKDTYLAGDTMHLGLNITNPFDFAIYVCVAIWLEKPTGPIYLLLHKHNVTLPAGFTYSNPNFRSFEIPTIPTGAYTWHAALLDPTTHSIVDEDTGEWYAGAFRIGALLPLTGHLATFGENELVAAEFAVQEVNQFLVKAGARWALELVVEDTACDPAIALEKIESLDARGIEFVLGPLSSAEVRAIKGYCDANEILVISHGSTAPDLAVPDDYIFRFAAQDKLGQGPAIGRIMYDDGKRYVIPVTRNDAWGVGLEEAAKLKFVDELGGTFLPGIRYDPEETEFTDEAADLASKVTSALATYPADQVAVLHISFEEVNAFMTACLAYPVLDDVKWYGSDGTAQSGAMLEDPDVRAFAMTVEYPCTIFAPTESAKWEKVRQHCIDVLGREPDPYAYVAYDVVWVYALSLLAVDKYDSEAVKGILPTVTENYFGASGW